MSFFQVVRSYARRQAVCSPMFRGRRSASIVRVLVCLGCPGGLHAGGGPRIAARIVLYDGPVPRQLLQYGQTA